ncbi:hypothetical protein LL251_17140 [Sphingobium naphthae]|nr:hypothetical protein [Sphingobium naphthae]
MIVEARNELENIAFAVGNSAVLAKVLAMAIADSTMEGDAVMALGALLERLSEEIQMIAARKDSE